MSSSSKLSIPRIRDRLAADADSKINSRFQAPRSG
jgi:hypothetical protein